EAIAGPDGKDPSAVTVKLRSSRTVRRASLKGLRVGVPTNYYFDVIDPEVDALVRAAIDELRRLGARIVPVAVPDVEYCLDACVVVAWYECEHFHRRFLFHRPQAYDAIPLDYKHGADASRST